MVIDRVLVGMWKFLIMHFYVKEINLFYSTAWGGEIECVCHKISTIRTNHICTRIIIALINISKLLLSIKIKFTNFTCCLVEGAILSPMIVLAWANKLPIEWAIFLQFAKFSFHLVTNSLLFLEEKHSRE